MSRQEGADASEAANCGTPPNKSCCTSQRNEAPRCAVPSCLRVSSLACTPFLSLTSFSRERFKEGWPNPRRTYGLRHCLSASPCAGVPARLVCTIIGHVRSCAGHCDEDAQFGHALLVLVPCRLFAGAARHVKAKTSQIDSSLPPRLASFFLP